MKRNAERHKIFFKIVIIFLTFEEKLQSNFFWSFFLKKKKLTHLYIFQSFHLKNPNIRVPSFKESHHKKSFKESLYINKIKVLLTNVLKTLVEEFF